MNKGLRVLGVSYKSELNENDVFSVEDESDMILTGYLAFLDPPKTISSTCYQGFGRVWCDHKDFDWRQ